MQKKQNKDIKKEKEAEEELSKALRNLDNYDGTSLNQEDI